MCLLPACPSAATTSFSDIQFDLGSFINPAQTINDGAGNVTVQFPPVYTLFLPAKLTRTPNVRDQRVLSTALSVLEASFPASPSGLLIFSVSYGLPYFKRLPAALVKANMPTLLSAPARSVLEEAVPSPTDVVGGQVGGPRAPIPGVTKDRFNVNVAIETNDMVFQLRSDNLTNLTSVALWLQGSNNIDGIFVPSPPFGGLYKFGTPRVQFVQQGLPRKLANNANFEFAGRINPDSSMAMGFVDQQTNAAGPAAIVTFAGNSSARLSSARPATTSTTARSRTSRMTSRTCSSSTPRPTRTPAIPTGSRSPSAASTRSTPTSSGRRTASRRRATPTSSPTAAVPRSSTMSSRERAQRWPRPGTAPARSPPPTRRSTPRSPARGGSATMRHCSARHGPPAALPCTSAWTAQAWTAWTCPRSGLSPARAEPTWPPAASSSSCSS